MNPFSLPHISSDDLRDYREDPEELIRFERRFAMPCQIGFFTAFGGFFAAMFNKGAFWPLPFIFIGMLVFAFGLLIMFFSTPTSANGRPMKKYWNKDSDSNGDEVIYVCDDSKTFFKRTWSKRRRKHI